MYVWLPRVWWVRLAWSLYALLPFCVLFAFNLVLNPIQRCVGSDLLVSLRINPTDVSMALNGLRIYWGGVKVDGKRRLQCGESVSDVRVTEEVMKLINEFMGGRVEKHRDVLLSESNTPFDRAINELSSWLTLMETKIKETSDEGIIRMRRAMIEVGRKMLRLARKHVKNG